MYRSLALIYPCIYVVMFCVYTYYLILKALKFLSFTLFHVYPSLPPFSSVTVVHRYHPFRSQGCKTFAGAAPLILMCAHTYCTHSIFLKLTTGTHDNHSF
jgi:succinate-acetate transporter protein